MRNKLLICIFIMAFAPLTVFGSGGAEPSFIEEPIDDQNRPNVIGNVKFINEQNLFPGINIQVTIYSKELGRSVPLYTSNEGEFYFYSIPPGVYKLEVWFDTTLNRNLSLNQAIQQQNQNDLAKQVEDLRTVENHVYNYSEYWFEDHPVKVERDIIVVEGESSLLEPIILPQQLFAALTLQSF